MLKWNYLQKLVLVKAAPAVEPVAQADDTECCHCCCVEPFQNLLAGTVLQELKIDPSQYDHDHHEPGQHPGMKNHRH